MRSRLAREDRCIGRRGDLGQLARNEPHHHNLSSRMRSIVPPASVCCAMNSVVVMLRATLRQPQDFVRTDADRLVVTATGAGIALIGKRSFALKRVIDLGKRVFVRHKLCLP